MLKIQTRLGIALVVALTVLFARTMGTHAAPEGNPEWHAKMRNLAETISDLIPNLSVPSRFRDSKNWPKIQESADRLSEFSHALKPMAIQDGQGTDPSLAMMSEMFHQEVARGAKEWKRGNRDYARGVLMSATNYCISCHSRSSHGLQLPGVGTDERFQELTLFEKADLAAALRQFDFALETFGRILEDRSLAMSQPLAWEKASRHALALAVRVKNDSELAHHFVKKILQTPSIPSYLRQDAQAWEKTILAWKKEGRRKVTSERGALIESTRLLAQAQKLQAYPADHSADMIYLRVTALVHDQLSAYPKGNLVADALYIAGKAYRSLDDLSLWFLNEFYFEACIRQSPRSAIARSCFQEYEESLYLGYSGSGGTSIPDDVSQKLVELRKLAGIK